MKSMTGFGRKDYRDAETELSIEIKTVNHRFRDFFIKLPRTLNPVEDRIRRKISETVLRGRVEVFIKYNELGAGSKRIIYNKELAKGYIGALNQMKNLDSMISDELDLGLIARFPDVISVEDALHDSDAIFEKLEPVLEAALRQLDESRVSEGENLKADVARRCEAIEEATEVIAQKSPEMTLKYQEELREKVIAYTESVEIDEKRLLTEVAIMADKLAIDEELIRLKSHTTRLRGFLEEEDEPIGRKLDFLVQEMNREINTVGSKANAIDIANLVVDVKSEIEKIREQIQNIE